MSYLDNLIPGSACLCESDLHRLNCDSFQLTLSIVSKPGRFVSPCIPGKEETAYTNDSSDYGKNHRSPFELM